MSEIRWEDLAAPGVRGSIGQVLFGSVQTVMYRDRLDGHMITAHYRADAGHWLVEGSQAWWIVEHAPTERSDTDGTPVRRSQLFTSDSELNTAWNRLREER